MGAISICDLEVRISGGVSETDPNLALGGAMSTVAGGLVDSQTAAAPTNVTGVVIDNAAGNAAGNGTLTYTNSGQTLTWADAGDTAGPAVDVSVNGVYALFSNTAGYLCVTVTSASLPGSDQNDVNITIANVINGVFDDVSADDSLAGDTEYRGLYIKNNHASLTANNVTIWIQSQPSGPDSLDIADGGEAVNVALETIADEDTAPVGETFTQPSTRSAGINLGTLTFGQFVGFWVRRTVPSNNTTPEANDTSTIGLAFTAT